MVDNVAHSIDVVSSRANARLQVTLQNENISASQAENYRNEVEAFVAHLFQVWGLRPQLDTCAWCQENACLTGFRLAGHCCEIGSPVIGSASPIDVFGSDRSVFDMKLGEPDNMSKAHILSRQKGCGHVSPFRDVCEKNIDVFSGFPGSHLSRLRWRAKSHAACGIAHRLRRQCGTGCMMRFISSRPRLKGHT
jgi:hypothetical protein